jgi:hypothetical protein
MNQSRPAGVANPTFTYTTSGFLCTDTASVVSGNAAFTTAATVSSPAGQYPITLSSSTLTAMNYAFTYVGAVLTVTPPDFTISATPTAFTIPTGQTASTSITLTPIGSYQGTIKLTCGPLPADVTCTFTSASNVLGSTTTTQLLIATDNFDHLSRGPNAPMPFGQFPVVLASVPLLLFFRLRKIRSVRRLFLAFVLCIGLTSGLLAGCADATRQDAVPGTSTITVTATDQSGLAHSLNLSLTLQ